MKILLNAVTEGIVPTDQAVLVIVSNKMKMEVVSSAGDSFAVNVLD